jgi:hypothetical protein
MLSINVTNAHCPMVCLNLQLISVVGDQHSSFSLSVALNKIYGQMWIDPS